jgi:hypothetical protein
MKLKVFVGMCVVATSAMAFAQNKISGTAHCNKPDVQQKVDISDHAGHMLTLTQAKCTWTKPLEVDGVQSKDGEDSGVSDLHGMAGTGHGYYIDGMANGDKCFVRWQGKQSQTGVAEGTWKYAGGTGKFKTLKGGGTYKGKAEQDGSVTFDVEGEYSLGK